MTDEKSSGSNDGTQDQGHTTYDAIRIVQNENGLFIKLNDATFARTDANRNRVANPQKTCALIIVLVLSGHRRTSTVTSTNKLKF